MSIYLGDNLISGTQVVTDKSERIGQIIQSTIPLVDAGLHLLDGSLLSGSGIYSQFVDYIASIYDASANYFCTEAQWQQSVTTYGVCGKFVYDSVNNTVRLPKITGKLDGTIDLSELGDIVAQYIKLPNITGGFETSDRGHNVYGAFTTRGGAQARGDNNGGAGNWIDLDASRSSSVYSGDGTNTKIHEQAINVFYYIVIATSTKTDIQVDIDEIATDLNGKADVDLTNVNNSGTSRGASWAMPSNAYEDLTFGASGTTYVAPANGWVLFSRYATDNSYGWTILGVLKENQTTVSDANMLYRTDAHTNTPSTGMTCFMPVKKGQTFFITYGGASANLLFFRFIYAQGSESEAS